MIISLGCHLEFSLRNLEVVSSLEKVLQVLRVADATQVEVREAVQVVSELLDQVQAAFICRCRVRPLRDRRWRSVQDIVVLALLPLLLNLSLLHLNFEG